MAQQVLVKCVICGKEEFVAPSRARGYRTCSLDCRRVYSSRRLSKKKDKMCPICGATFKVKPSHFNKRLCCSLKCSAKYRVMLSLGSTTDLVLSGNYQALYEFL